MSRIDYDLSLIKAFLFDVDGVLSCDMVPLHPSGEPMRMVNIKDGYALQLAVKHGYHVGIITGGATRAVRIRFEALGLQHIYMGSRNKCDAYQDFLAISQLAPHQVLYMGDDIPDYELLQQVGLPTCPADAVPEIKEVARYISPKLGGNGCGRDVIEQVMKAQGTWMTDDAFGW